MFFLLKTNINIYEYNITLSIQNLELIEVCYSIRNKNNFTTINLNGFCVKQLIG